MSKELLSIGKRLHRELGSIGPRVRPRLWFWTGLARMVPSFTLVSLRARLYRQAGCRIGPQVALLGSLRLLGEGDIASRLEIGQGSLMATMVTCGLDGAITLGQNVSIGPGVTLYTATHGIGFGSRRMNPGVVV